MIRIHRGSVLPRVDLLHRRDGGVLVRAVRVTSADLRELVLYGLAFLMVGSVVFVPRGGVMSHVARVVQAAGFFSAFFGVLTTYLRRRRLFRATLFVPRWPLRLGDEVTVRFRAMLKKSTPVSSLTAALQCVEHVAIGYGREQVLKSSTLYEQQLHCAGAKRQIAEEEWTVTIPPDLPPSFAVQSNRIEWRVSAQMMDVPADFVLLVLPEIASR